MSRVIKSLYVHCTDSDDSLDIGRREIEEWHRQRGFISESGISCGYHYIVRRDGRVEVGRPEHETGAHVKGHNSNSIGVVWVGRKQIGTNQLKSLYKVCKDIIIRHNIQIDKVLGHYESDPGKTCPNLNMDFIRAELLFVQPDKEEP